MSRLRLAIEQSWTTSTWPKRYLKDRSKDVVPDLESYQHVKSDDWDESFWNELEHELQPEYYQEEQNIESNIAYANPVNNPSNELDEETFLGIENMNSTKFLGLVGFGFAIFFCFFLFGHIINWRLKRRSNQRQRYEMELYQANSNVSNTSGFSKERNPQSPCAKQTLNLQLKKVSVVSKCYRKTLLF